MRREKVPHLLFSVSSTLFTSARTQELSRLEENRLEQRDVLLLKGKEVVLRRVHALYSLESWKIGTIFLNLQVFSLSASL